MFEKKVIAVGKVTNGKVEIQTGIPLATPVETVPAAWEQARIEAEREGQVRIWKFFSPEDKR